MGREVAHVPATPFHPKESEKQKNAWSGATCRLLRPPKLLSGKSMGRREPMGTELSRLALAGTGGATKLRPVLAWGQVGDG